MANDEAVYIFNELNLSTDYTSNSVLNRIFHCENSLRFYSIRNSFFFFGSNFFLLFLYFVSPKLVAMKIGAAVQWLSEWFCFHLVLGNILEACLSNRCMLTYSLYVKPIYFPQFCVEIQIYAYNRKIRGLQRKGKGETQQGLEE